MSPVEVLKKLFPTLAPKARTLVLKVLSISSPIPESWQGDLTKAFEALSKALASSVRYSRLQNLDGLRIKDLQFTNTLYLFVEEDLLNLQPQAGMLGLSFFAASRSRPENTRKTLIRFARS